MSRKNRNNNRYNSRNRNQWDEGLDDYFDDDDEEQLESEEEESSEEQDEYDDGEYEDEEYEDEEDYEEDEEEYEDDEEEYEDDEEYEEEEVDEEEDEYEETDEEEYDEEDEEEVDEEEEEYEQEDEEGEEDELEDEINAATESTAKKGVGNSDLLQKLRGQMRPQLNEDAAESSSDDSSSDAEINISPLSLFGQPIGQSGRNNNSATSKGTSAVPSQQAAAKTAQSASAGSRATESKPSAPVQKSGSGRVITAQSQNGASVSSVQPRDLEAEKAEAERKQKEKERLENEQKEQEEKSSRILDKFKGKKASAGEAAMNNTKAGAAWLWSGLVWIGSKIASSAVWIWMGIAACFIWVFWTAPKHVWQNWNVFSYKWWSGIGSGVWNVMKKPFAKKAVPATQDAQTPVTGEAELNGMLSGSAPTPASQESAAVASASTGKKRSRKNSTPAEEPAVPVGNTDNELPDVIASKEPDSRRRLYWSLTSIGAAAVLFLLVLPAMLPGNKKTDENAVASANDQNNDSEASNQSDNSVQSNDSEAVSNDTSSVITQNSISESPVLSTPNSGTSNMRNVNNQNSGASNMRNMNNQNSGAPNMRNVNNRNSGTPNMRTPSPNSDNPRFGGSSGASLQSMYPTSPSTSNGRNMSPARNNPQTYDNNSTFVTPPVNPGAVTAPSLENPNLDVSAPEIVVPDLPATDDAGGDLIVPDYNASNPEDAVSALDTPLDTTAPEAGELGNPDINVQEPDLGLTLEEPALDVPETDLTIPDASTDEVPVPQNVEPDITVPETTTPELINSEEPVADLSESLDPLPDANDATDPLNMSSPDVPEDSTVDLTPEANDPSPVVTQPDLSVPSSPDLTSGTPNIPESEVDVPDLSMPELTEPQLIETNPVDSNPIEAPSIPEPTVPEPTVPEPTIPEPTVPEPTVPEPTVPEPTAPEPTPIETGVAMQTPESTSPSESLLTPETNLPNSSQVADSPAEMPQSPSVDSSVELGMPGPLVSSNAGKTSSSQAAPGVNQMYYSNTPSTSSGNGTNGYNNSYAAGNVGGNYNRPLLENKGVYIVQPTDCYWSISERIYGSGYYAPALAKYNSSRVGSESLSVSSQISTPPVETLERQFPELCPVHRKLTATEASVDEPPSGTRIYIVDQEETVMEIAQRELGNVIYCSQIYQLNQQLLSGSIDRVPPGSRLLLPVLK